MIISLDLSRHCIETAARLKREDLVRRCLKSPAPEEEAQLDYLTPFLEQADFPALRSRINAQVPHARQATLIFNQSPRRLQIHVNDRIILPVWQA